MNFFKQFVMLWLIFVFLGTSSYANNSPLWANEINQQDENDSFVESYASKSTTGVIQQVDFSITDDQRMVVSYNFNPVEDASEYLISLRISTDGGITFFSPKAVSGAIQKKGKSGRNTIEWDIFSDVDELSGDIQVEVEAKLHRTIKQKVFAASINKKAKTNGLGAYMAYPLLNFENSIYKSHIDSGVLKRGLAIGCGLTYISLPSQINIDVLVNNYDVPDYDISYYQTSLSASMLYTILPNIPLVTPFIGLGLQMSELADPEDSNRSVTVNTSDLFVTGSLLIVPGDSYFMKISYKSSMFRKIRKWNQLQINIGKKL